MLMPFPAVFSLTFLAMLAFAGNSVFGRLALSTTAIDPSSYTAVRLACGAVVLCLLVAWRESASLRQLLPKSRATWLSSLALFVYAVALSFSYADLTTATGAVLLFGAVQATMIGYGILRGERLDYKQWSGVAISILGFIGLMLPGVETPELVPAIIMSASGVAWGIYSLRGQGADKPLTATATNFLGATVMAALLVIIYGSQLTVDAQGFMYAALSGGLTSAIGYAIWYQVLPWMASVHAASVQLTVPVLTAIGGVLFVSEPLTWRLTLASAAILGGIALVILNKPVVGTK